MNKHNVFKLSTVGAFSVLATLAFAGMHPDDGHQPGGSAVSDPQVTDTTVKDANQLIDSSNISVQPVLIDTLVAMSVAMEGQQAAQALYSAGHKNYKLERFAQSENAFQDLAALAAGTLLEIDALRMLAQIDIVFNEDIQAALAHYEDALVVLDGISGIPAIDRELSALSFMPNMAHLYESAGDDAAALSMAQAVINEVAIHPGVKAEAIRQAGRCAMATDQMALAETYYQQYLNEYPDDGWGNGVRIEAERRLRVAQGMSWGLGYAQEIQFCSDILNDQSYMSDPERYQIGSHLATVLFKRGYASESGEIFVALIAEAQGEVQAANTAGETDLELKLKEHAEGMIRFAYARYLAIQGQEVEARAQMSILQADPDFGVYSTYSAVELGLESVPAP